MSDRVDSAGPLREVRATFASADEMQKAVSELSISGFDRADISLPSPALVAGADTPESGTKPASTGEDAQQMRTLGASTAASVAALAAAGVTIATGGAAAPAIAAAVVALTANPISSAAANGRGLRATARRPLGPCRRPSRS